MEEEYFKVRVYNDNGDYIGVMGVLSFAQLEDLASCYFRFEYTN